MKERPILFNAPMVRALLDGTKTQTRRVVKPQPDAGADKPRHLGDGDWQFVSDINQLADSVPAIRCPYGQPGDRLWVRETFARIDGQTRPWIETDYRATYKHGDRLGDTLGIKKRWTPSIHMPRAASRITLEITSVRVERLQDISGKDCWAEGISEIREKGDEHGDLNGSVTHDYRALWESINGPGSWDANPWVWVVEFKRVTP